MNRIFAKLRQQSLAVGAFIALLYGRLLELPSNIKEAVLLALDLVAIPLALTAGMVLRYGHFGFAIGQREILAGLLTVLISAIIFLRLGLYRAVVRFMGHEAIIAIVKGVTLSALTLSLMMLLSQAHTPRSLPVLYWFLMMVCVGGSRLALRSWYRHHMRRNLPRVAIYGAGSAGRQLLTALQCGEQCDPVLFIDDNPGLHGKVINDVPVISSRELPVQLKCHAVTEVFLAMASLSNSRRREIINSLSEYAVQVRSIPSFEDLVRGRAAISEVQEISLEDLLGRVPVPPRPELVARCIAGKTVMITGAGGSIGAELCRQILAESPRQLLLVDCSEYALYSIDRELQELAVRRGFHARIVPLLGSVQDYVRMRMIIDNFAVETVYHAAAYKHVPIVEHNVVEGVRNNVLGTVNVARAAAECSVSTFVLVSTDKAVRPSNIMGASKRVSEMVMQAMAAAGGRTRFVIVRFGNVIGSSGSAIPLFTRQINTGGPVTVTHADAERYFMTIPEAAQLVLQASAMGSGGDVFVLDMGEPIRIVELARRMIHLAGMEVRDEQNPQGDIEIQMIGLRPGEKMREELLMCDDVGATGHPMILRALEEFLPWAELKPVIEQLEAACVAYDCSRIREIFSATVRGFDNRYGCSDPMAERVRRNAPAESARVEQLFAHRAR